MNETGVAETRIGMSNAGPGSPAAELGFCDRPEGIAMADRVLRRSARESDRRRHNDFRTYLKNIRIGKTGIQSEQFRPAASIAKPRRRELPQCGAGLNGDDRQF